VIHRDIKPGNILLSEGHAVLADFGIARAVSVSAQDRMTRTGLGVGTPLYASPEQTAGQETVDGRADIYALGCVLYEMLSGEVPLAGPTPQSIQAKRLTETPTPLTVLRDTVPPPLDAVISRALAKVPADRWNSAGDLEEALRKAVLDTTPINVPQPRSWSPGSSTWRGTLHGKRLWPTPPGKAGRRR
jgi:serine/threonine-protein kinase